MGKHLLHDSVFKTVSNHNEYKHFLFLQGPVGPFFKELGKKAKELGYAVTRINFNAGDLVDWAGPETVSYRGRSDLWPQYLKKLAIDKNITDVFIYGDCRPLHKAALKILKPMGVQVHVFEEGYIRPNYVTYEQDGVNANSSMSRNKNFYREYYKENKEKLHNKPIPVPPANTKMYAYALKYYISVFFGGIFYPNFKRHRLWPSWKETIGWIGRLATLPTRQRKAFQIQKRLYQKRERFYLALLQLCGDSQIQNHSDYSSMHDYIEHIIRDFALHAPIHTRLVFKNHPLDNGLNALEKFTKNIAKKCGVEHRVYFVDGGRLKGLAQVAQGVITINSTAGFSALHHKTALISMGDAIYNFDGLTHQNGLETFWNTPTLSNRDVYKAYRATLTAMTQLNGNYFNEEGRELLTKHFFDTKDVKIFSSETEKPAEEVVFSKTASR